MFSARKKIAKEKGAEPDEFEESVAQVCSCHTISQSSRVKLATQLIPSQAIFDLEATNQELKGDLRDLYITSAKEVEVASARKAIVIHVSGTAVCSGP